MNKTLSKAIMLRTKVRNKFLTNRTDESKTNYVKQRNLCVSLLRKIKKRKISAITRHFKKQSNQCYLKKLSPMKKPASLKWNSFKQFLFKYCSKR